MNIGLTGTIGCGKSTAGRLLGERGIERIDCDEIVRELLVSDSQVLREIVDAFGTSVFAADGSLNRKALGAIVFADRSRLAVLEEILHPRVSDRWQGRIRGEPDRHHVVEIPLLFEKNLQKWFDFTICVACDRRTQLERLGRRGMTAEEADQRIAAQLPLSRKIDLADCVLLNSGTLPFLSDQIDWLTQTRNLT
ncbi:MAG: dephospho-CoA kinase [Opitutaceae bacterium]